MSGVPGMPLPAGAPGLRPCGTPAAYRRHLRRGEPADPACQAAADAAFKALPRRRRKRRIRAHLPRDGAPSSLCGLPWDPAMAAVADRGASLCGNCETIAWARAQARARPLWWTTARPHATPQQRGREHAAALARRRPAA